MLGARAVGERLALRVHVSRRVLRAGYAIAYEPDAAVFHSHAYSVMSAMRRFFDSGVSAGRSYVDGSESAAALRRASIRYARGELSWLWTTGQRRWIPYTAVYEIAKFTGLQLGRRNRRLPASITSRLSALPNGPRGTGASPSTHADDG